MTDSKTALKTDSAETIVELYNSLGTNANEIMGMPIQATHKMNLTAHELVTFFCLRKAVASVEALFMAYAERDREDELEAFDMEPPYVDSFFGDKDHKIIVQACADFIFAIYDDIDELERECGERGIWSTLAFQSLGTGIGFHDSVSDPDLLESVDSACDAISWGGRPINLYIDDNGQVHLHD